MDSRAGLLALKSQLISVYKAGPSLLPDMTQGRGLPWPRAHSWGAEGPDPSRQTGLESVEPQAGGGPVPGAQTSRLVLLVFPRIALSEALTAPPSLCSLCLSPPTRPRPRPPRGPIPLLSPGPLPPFPSRGPGEDVEAALVYPHGQLPVYKIKMKKYILIFE